MAQGMKFKVNKAVPSRKQVQKAASKKKFSTKKGAPTQLPKGSFRNEALDDRELSKAISKSNEQKMSAKVIQAGGHMGLKDLVQVGKDLSRDQRREQVKKKKSRVEEKLAELKKLQEGKF